MGQDGQSGKTDRIKHFYCKLAASNGKRWFSVLFGRPASDVSNVQLSDICVLIVKKQLQCCILKFLIFLKKCHIIR